MAQTFSIYLFAPKAPARLFFLRQFIETVARCRDFAANSGRVWCSDRRELEDPARRMRLTAMVES